MIVMYIQIWTYNNSSNFKIQKFNIRNLSQALFISLLSLLRDCGAVKAFGGGGGVQAPIRTGPSKIYFTFS